MTLGTTDLTLASAVPMSHVSARTLNSLGPRMPDTPSPNALIHPMAVQQ